MNTENHDEKIANRVFHTFRLLLWAIFGNFIWKLAEDIDWKLAEEYLGTC